jgi:hypothetical protein
MENGDLEGHFLVNGKFYPFGSPMRSNPSNPHDI